MPSPEPAHHVGNLFAIVIDCALAAAIVAAYIPQVRQLRKSTTSETPSNDGLSTFYIFFHGIFCTNLLAMAILTMWAVRMNDEYTPLATLNAWLHVAPMFSQWLCGMAVTITYVVGHQRGEGKCLVPLIVFFHAAFVLLFSQGSLERRDSMTSGISTMLVYIAALFSAPFVLVGQPWAQWYELRQRRDFGALSVRSTGLQAAVMGAMAIRLLVHFGWRGWAMLFTGELRLGERFAVWLQWHFMEVHYLLWVAGAVTVWLKTRANKSKDGENVELGSLLDWSSWLRQSCQ